jgi:DNA-binding transcriptional LysR family regulator
LSLDEHCWVMSEDSIDFSPFPAWRKKFHPKSHMVFTSNNMIMVLDAAKRGLGVTPLPCFLGDAEADLVRFSDTTDELTLGLWVLIHPDLRNTARVKALMTYLLDKLENNKAAIEGLRG